MKLKTLWIDPINTCNLECIMCRFKHKSGNEITMDDLRDLLIQARDMEVEKINFGITAESTLYGSLYHILDESRALGFIFTMSTNLNFNKMGDDLFRAISLIDNLSISIDAATKRTYEYIRKGGKWNVLLSNLNRLGKYREGKKVTARFVIQKRNIQEIARFVDFIHAFPFFKEIVFEPINFAFMCKRKRKLTEWNYSDLLGCLKELQEGYRKARIYGIECKEYITVAAMVHNESLFLEKGYESFAQGCVQYLHNKRFPISNPCFQPGNSVYISAKREVYMCECAYRAKEFFLGDLRKQNLRAIWGSPLARRLRLQLSKGIRPQLCRTHCYCFDGQIKRSINLWQKK